MATYVCDDVMLGESVWVRAMQDQRTDDAMVGIVCCDRTDLPAEPSGMNFADAGAKVVYLRPSDALRLARRMVEAVAACPIAGTSDWLRTLSLGDLELLQAVES